MDLQGLEPWSSSPIFKKLYMLKNINYLLTWSSTHEGLTEMPNLHQRVYDTHKHVLPFYLYKAGFLSIPWPIYLSETFSIGFNLWLFCSEVSHQLGLNAAIRQPSCKQEQSYLRHLYFCALLKSMRSTACFFYFQCESIANVRPKM